MKRLIFLAICAWLFLLFPGCKSALAEHSVALGWTASSDAAANPTLIYNLYRLSGNCPATVTPGSGTAFKGITGLTYTDTPLAPGTYCYYATAYLNGAESVPSNTVQAVVLPSPPTALVVASTK